MQLYLLNKNRIQSGNGENYMNEKYRFMTVREVAEKLFSMKEGENIDFTFDNEEYIQEPTGWYGLKKVTIFDEPYGNICIGDYGACATRIHSISDNTVDEIAEIIQQWLDDESGFDVEKICVEMKAEELWEE